MSLFMKNILAILTLTIATTASASISETPSIMRHGLNYILTLDVEQMEKLVSREFKPVSNERDDEIFLNVAAKILSETVLVHPHFAEREGAISRLKSKMAAEDYVDVLERSAKMLLAILKNDKKNAADEATALVALSNLVIEARHLPKEDMESTLKTIAAANLEVSDSAREYGREPLNAITSPSAEAKAAL